MLVLWASSLPYVYACGYVVVKISLYKANQYLKTALTSTIAHKLPRLLGKSTVSLTLTENDKSFRLACPTRLIHDFTSKYLTRLVHIVIWAEHDINMTS